MNKKTARLRRAARGRAKIRELGVPRLCVTKSLQHMYAQIINAAQQVVASASTLEKNSREEFTRESKNGSEKAAFVGQLVAERARQAGIERVAFDRSGYKYHGKVKALADSARANGLIF